MPDPRSMDEVFSEKLTRCGESAREAGRRVSDQPSRRSAATGEGVMKGESPFTPTKRTGEEPMAAGSRKSKVKDGLHSSLDRGCRGGDWADCAVCGQEPPARGPGVSGH